MLSSQCVLELRSSWLPNMTDCALDRLVDLLEKDSPLLIHGAFTRAVPMGCLATQAAWNHPRTARLTQEAGVTWLSLVAGLNPGTSHVIREWDAAKDGHTRFQVRQEILALFRAEQERRREAEVDAEWEAVAVEV